MGGDHIDPKDVPGSNVSGSNPDVGGSVTIDSEGHVRKIEVDVHVPGTAGGSKPGHVEHDFGGHDPASPKPGWTPHLDTGEPPYNPLPVQPGWVRDPATGLDHPDFGGGTPASGTQSEPGDYEPPPGDERYA